MLGAAPMPPSEPAEQNPPVLALRVSAREEGIASQTRT
jgi:hypothetical protein